MTHRENIMQKMKVTLSRDAISLNKTRQIALDRTGAPAANGNHHYFADLRTSAKWEVGQTVEARAGYGAPLVLTVTAVERPVTGDVILTLEPSPAERAGWFGENGPRST